MKPDVSHPFKLAQFAGLLLLAGLILAACQPSAPIPVTSATEVPTMAPVATTAPTATSAPAAAEPTVNVATDPKLGKILVDDKGMTLYIFTKDAADKSNCDAACLDKWPALVTNGSPNAGDGVDAAMLGSTALADGRKIVTYNHMPLYTWVKDAKPGDTTGQNVGTVWFVVAPDGKPVMEMASSATPAASTEPVINMTTDAKLGKILVDAKGMTLYIFTNDTADTSNCNAACLEKWPPLVTDGKPVAGDGVDGSKLGFATLADGRKIATYDHKPLYYWVNDAKPGDTTGQGVGSVWYVIAP
jgi:predicted lipoprotein with Yx(FWY)xxD motif